MKFLVERTVDGISKFNVVEAESPIEAMKKDDLETFLGVITGVKNERSVEIENHEVGTVGIYEIGQINHLEAIVESAEKMSWANNRIEELSNKIASNS